MNYIVLEGNRVVQHGRAQQEFWPPGAIAVNTLPRPHDFKVYWVGGAYVYSSDPVVVPTYDAKRRLAYPSAGEQLDMLWHAMDDGLMPKVEPWYSTIKAVKQAHPKPA